MQHPALSTVWTYQTADEQAELLDLYAELCGYYDDIDQVRDEVRRIRGRAFMRRLNGIESSSYDYFSPAGTR